MTPATLRLELLCAERDREIADLRYQLIVEHLRQCEGVSHDTPFNPRTRQFMVPPSDDHA